MTINDGRTSQCCRALSGIIRKIDDPFWATHTPPNHHRCRSVVVSLTEKEAQKRSPPMVGLNQPESPEMQPQKGWDYNPALSHQNQIRSLLDEKIDKLPNASNWFKQTVREQAEKKLAQQAGLVESQVEKQIADKTTMIDKQGFADFVEKVTAENYHARHEFIQVGTLPDFVMVDSAVSALEPVNNEIHMSDYQLRHSLRKFKSEKGATVPLDEIKQLPEKLENATWFYDSVHNNVLAVFDVNLIDEVGKSVVAINFERRKPKELINVVVTSGIIAPEHLKNKRYRKIEVEP